MSMIKEPLDIDFEVDPRPLTEKEKEAISDFIKADKAKRKERTTRRKTTNKKNVK